MLKLWFNMGISPVLLRTEYIPAGSGDRHVAIRGRQASSAGVGCFGWSRAVRALCILFVNGAINRKVRTDSPVLLSGERGSLAASLDYSIMKEPQWLVDMFGHGRDGRSGIHKIVLRTNSNFKRAGPVEFRIRSRMFEENRIQIFFGENSSPSQTELSRLLNSLLDGAKELKAPRASNNLRFGKVKSILSTRYSHEIAQLSKNGNGNNSKAESRQLKQAYLNELENSLRETSVFSRGWEHTLLQRLLDRHQVYQEARRVARIADFTSSLTSCERRGVISDDAYFKPLCANEPLTVAACNGPGKLALILGVRYLKGLNVLLNSNFEHSQEILQQLRLNLISPDSVILGIGQTLQLMGMELIPRYYPIMIMPGSSNRLVGLAPELQTGKDLVVYEDSDVLIREYQHEGMLDLRRLGIRRVPADGVIEAAMCGDSSTLALLWFPQYVFAGLLGNRKCRSVVDDGARRSSQLQSHSSFLSEGAVLLVHERHVKTELPKVFSAAIRDVWVSLARDRTLREFFVDLCLSDNDGLELVRRAVETPLLFRRVA